MCLFWLIFFNISQSGLRSYLQACSQSQMRKSGIDCDKLFFHIPPLKLTYNNNNNYYYKNSSIAIYIVLRTIEVLDKVVH